MVSNGWSLPNQLVGNTRHIAPCKQFSDFEFIDRSLFNQYQLQSRMSRPDSLAVKMCNASRINIILQSTTLRPRQASERGVRTGFVRARQRMVD